MTSKWIVRTALALTVLIAGALILTLINLNSPVAGAESLAPAPPSGEMAASAPAVQAESALARTITVVGEGRVRMRPDMAQTNIGVEVVSDTVKEASRQAAETMGAVMEALKAQGVDEKDMQTAGYSIWVERPYGPEGPARDESLYHVSNSVSVTIRDLDKVGPILDAAIEAGANNIYGVNFNVAEPGVLMSEARQKAVVDAQAKVQELAGLNNVQVGEVISISEVIGGGGGFFPSFSRASVAEGLGGGGGPISPGELELTVQLQVTYAIQ